MGMDSWMGIGNLLNLTLRSLKEKKMKIHHTAVRSGLFSSRYKTRKMCALVSNRKV